MPWMDLDRSKTDYPIVCLANLVSETRCTRPALTRESPVSRSSTASSGCSVLRSDEACMMAPRASAGVVGSARQLGEDLVRDLFAEDRAVVLAAVVRVDVAHVCQPDAR